MKDEMIGLSASFNGFVHPSAFILPPCLQLRRRNLLDHVGFDLIGDLYVVKVLEADTAFEAFTNFRNIVLEAAHRGNVSFPGHHAIANQTRARVAADDAVDDHAAGDCAHPWYAEDFADVGLAENLFPLDLF